MDHWEIGLLAAAGYIAVTSLVRLMIRHRDQMLGEFRQKLEAEKQRKQDAEKRRQSGRRPKAA